MLKSGGKHVGWEATCRDPKHREDTACRRSLRFARHGGRENVLRKLKWWLLESYDYDTRKDHVTACPWVPLLGEDYLPSTAELERRNLRYDAGDVAAAEVPLPKAKSKAKAKVKAAPKAAKSKPKARPREPEAEAEGPEPSSSSRPRRSI